MAELAHDYEGRVLVAKMDTDGNPRTPGHYGIMGIPTLIVFRDGQEVQRVVGVRPKPALSQMLDGILHLVRQVAAGEARVENVYGVAVTEEGNAVARELVDRLFEPAPAVWRAVGWRKP